MREIVLTSQRWQNVKNHELLIQKAVPPHDSATLPPHALSPGQLLLGPSLHMSAKENSIR